MTLPSLSLVSPPCPLHMFCAAATTSLLLLMATRTSTGLLGAETNSMVESVVLYTAGGSEDELTNENERPSFGLISSALKEINASLNNKILVAH
jgi:hypothetical protein